MFISTAETVAVGTDHEFVCRLPQRKRLTVTGIEGKRLLFDIRTQTCSRGFSGFIKTVAGKRVIGIGFPVGIAHTDFAVAAVAEVMFQIGEHVVAVHFKFVPIRTDKYVLRQGRQFTVGIGRQAVVRREVALLVKIACAQNRIRVDIPIRRRVEGFVVVIFLGRTGRCADGLRHHAAAHAAVGVQTA